MFGVTRKKAGWDCMRHLEIMANGAVPFFTDLQELPAKTMQHYPKHLFQKALSLTGVTFRGSAEDPSSFQVNLTAIDLSLIHI